MAENGWNELVRRQALVVLAATMVLGLWVPVYLEHKWVLAAAPHAQSAQAMQQIILETNRLVLYVALCICVLFAAGSIESEVSRRTLSSVMIRPIHRWEYLAGRALSVLLFFSLFAWTAVLLSYGMAFFWGSALRGVYLWGVVQRICRSATWILMALSLGSILSSATAITWIMIIAVLAALAPHLPNDYPILVLIKRLVYYATPCAWPTDFLGNQPWGEASLWLNLGVVIENLIYGMVVFLGCAWIFTRRDLKLK